MNKEANINKQIESVKEDLDKEKLTFLYKAIEDAQETIRLTEFLKVSYIREIKLRRINNIRNWIFSSLTLSLILFCIHFIGLSFYMPGSHKNAVHFPEFILHLF